MATSKKSPFFLTLATGAQAQVQLDPDIYSSAVITELGLAATKTTDAKLLRVTKKTLANSTFAGIVRVTVGKGVGTPEEEFRQLELLCEASKLDTAKAGLAAKIVKLGYGATAVDWTIQA